MPEEEKNYELNPYSSSSEGVRFSVDRPLPIKTQPEVQDPKDVVIILDGWADCVQDKYVCIPPEKDIRYDLKQLATLLEGYPVSLSYSEVGIFVEETVDLSSVRRSSKRPNRSVKQSVKGNPLYHFGPKPSYRATKKASIIKPEVEKLPDKESPIFIFHDFYRSQSEWQAFAADLAVMLRRRVIVVDLRNHGTSPFSTSRCGIGEYLADMRNLFKELNLKAARFTLIGHGISGWSIMIFALLYPYKVRNIILIEANPSHNYHLASQVAKAETGLIRVQTPPRGRPLPKLKLKVSEFLTNYVTNVSLKAYIVQNIVVDDVVGRPEKWETKKTEIITSLNSYTRFPEFLKLHNFDKPVLFVASSASKVLKPEHEPDILKLFPQAKFIYYEKVTKSPHVELFDDFLDMVRDFLQADKLS